MVSRIGKPGMLQVEYILFVTGEAVLSQGVKFMHN